MARESFPLDNAEETDFDTLQGLYLPGEDESSILVPPNEVDDQSDLYGKPVSVQGGQLYVPAVSTPREKRETSWAVQLQIVQAIDATGNPSSYVGQGLIVATITYGVGEATFTKKVIVPTSVPIKVNVWGRFVTISLSNVGGGAGTSTEVACAACPGVFLGPDFYAWSWSQVPIHGVDNGSLWTGAAVLGQIHVMISAVPVNNTQAVWPLLFDSKAAPAANAKPILGGRLGAVIAVGDDRSQTDEQAPGTIGWNSGLWVALSADPYQYVAPNAGFQMTAECKAGQ